MLFSTDPIRDTVPRESHVDFYGQTFKAVDWRLYRGFDAPNSVDPWLDEEPIKRKHWRSFKPGDVVLDIGAAFGCYTMPALLQGATVLAFEPTTEWSSILRESIAMTPRYAGRGIVFRHALWNGTPYPQDLAQEVFGVRYPEGTVDMKTIDEMCADLPRVDAVKIDVEAAEWGVIQGGIETLRRCRPKFVIEDHTGIYDYCSQHDTAGKIEQCLRENGYRVRRELFGVLPPPGGGRYFIIGTP